MLTFDIHLSFLLSFSSLPTSIIHLILSLLLIVNMPIKLSSRILLTSDVLPSRVSVHDDGGVIIQGEDNKAVNPFVCDQQDWNSVLKDFGTETRWALPEAEGDLRFVCFNRGPPNIRRPEWLLKFLEYGRKLRSDFKSKGHWKRQQALLKLLVSRFFHQSKAPKTERSLFRACIVLGLFLICDSKDGSMTNMVLHLARSCSPPARSTTLDPKPVRVSRPGTKDDLRKVIQNQETLHLMLLKISMELGTLTQNRKRTRTNHVSKEPDQEADDVFEIAHLSDDSASASEVEDDVEDVVEDQMEYEGGEELEAGDEDEVQYEDHDEVRDRDDDDDEESHSEDEEYGRGRKRQRPQPSSGSL
jgi:hypothetical protein